MIQTELSRFIKFACNQDRIPMSIDDGQVLPLPYPMKIAPSDKPNENQNNQFIRVETCMFMIKLPRYKSMRTMREKILFAISCSADPLSG